MHGIVTYHDGINFGAYLQVYALHKTLLRLGFDNEVINYKNRDHWLNEYKCLFRTKSPALFLANLIKLIKFRRAQQRIRQTKFSFTPEGLGDMQFDTVVFGSDEIWNYTNPLFSKDLFYFGRGVPAKRLVSYAASCGNLDVNVGFPPDIKECVAKFNAIAVRDENSQAIVKRAVGVDAEIVLDPTFLHDYSSEEVACQERNFIMIYTTGFDVAMQKAVRAYADSQGKKLISVGYRNRFCDQNVIGVDPFEFLGYMRAADSVITSMFHGTVFAIKYQKNFCLITDPYRTNKLASLLAKLGLEGRRFGPDKSIDAVLSHLIDYAPIAAVLASEIERSETYLKKALTNAG